MIHNNEHELSDRETDGVQLQQLGIDVESIVSGMPDRIEKRATKTKKLGRIIAAVSTGVAVISLGMMELDNSDRLDVPDLMYIAPLALSPSGLGASVGLLLAARKQKIVSEMFRQPS